MKPRPAETQREEERTVIYSTHNLAEVQVACNRVLIVARGTIVADDTPEQLSDRAGKGRFIATVATKDKASSAVRETLLKVEGVNQALAERIHGYFRKS